MVLVNDLGIQNVIDYFTQQVTWRPLLTKFSGVKSEPQLQLYLYHNITRHFPTIRKDDLLLYEQAIFENRTDVSKIDFLFKTQNSQLMVIEVKYLDFRVSGKTAKTRRNKHRSKVRDQVRKHASLIEREFNLNPEDVIGAVFTNEDRFRLNLPSIYAGIKFVSVTDQDWDNWISIQDQEHAKVKSPGIN